MTIARNRVAVLHGVNFDVLERRDALVYGGLSLAELEKRISDWAHELEDVGTMHVLNACAGVEPRRLVMISTTLVYGAHPKNPNFLTEDSELRGHRDSRFVNDKVRAEKQVQRFAREHPDVSTCVLRFAPILGPLVFLALCGVWVAWASRAPDYSVVGALREHFVNRAVHGMHHKQPPWYYLGALPPGLFPWTGLLPGALALAWRRRRDAFDRFLFAWFVFILLFFSISTGLPAATRSPPSRPAPGPRSIT